jgi:hypothetical protein
MTREVEYVELEAPEDGVQTGSQHRSLQIQSPTSIPAAANLRTQPHPRPNVSESSHSSAPIHHQARQLRSSSQRVGSPVVAVSQGDATHGTEGTSSGTHGPDAGRLSPEEAAQVLTEFRNDVQASDLWRILNP